AQNGNFNEEPLPSLEDSKNVQFEIASHCSSHIFSHIYHGRPGETGEGGVIIGIQGSTTSCRTASASSSCLPATSRSRARRTQQINNGVAFSFGPRRAGLVEWLSSRSARVPTVAKFLCELRGYRSFTSPYCDGAALGAIQTVTRMRFVHA